MDQEKIISHMDGIQTNSDSPEVRTTRLDLRVFINIASGFAAANMALVFLLLNLEKTTLRGYAIIALGLFTNIAKFALMFVSLVSTLVKLHADTTIVEVTPNTTGFCVRALLTLWVTALSDELLKTYARANGFLS